MGHPGRTQPRHGPGRRRPHSALHHPRPGRHIPGAVRRDPRRRRCQDGAQRGPDAAHELHHGTVDPKLPPRTAGPDPDLEPGEPAARPARTRFSAPAKSLVLWQALDDPAARRTVRTTHDRLRPPVMVTLDQGVSSSPHSGLSTARTCPAPTWTTGAGGRADAMTAPAPCPTPTTCTATSPRRDER